MKAVLDDLDGRLGGALQAAARRPLVAVAFLLAVALPAFLAGFFDIPPIDRTEVRYAQVSKQMIETGDFANPRFQAEPQPSKPIGVFWLQSAVAGVLGQNTRAAIWVYRLPSLLGALGAVLITFFGARRHFGREAALIGALLLGVNIIVVLQAHLALSKGLHLAFVVAAQWSLARLYIAERGDNSARDAAIFWTAQGGGILTGAFGLPLLSLATIAGLALADRELGWLKRLHALWGLPLTVLITTPWIAVLALNWEPELMRQAWAEGWLGQLAGPQQMNWRGFPGMYLLGLLLGLLPGAMFLGRAVQRMWGHRGQRPARFLLSWVFAYLLAIELLSAKPPLYTLQMLMPALAVAIGMALSARGAGEGPVLRPHGAYWAGALVHGLLPALGLFGLIWVAGPPLSLLPLGLGLIAVLGVVGASAAVLGGRPFAWLGLSIAASLLVYIAALQLVLPKFGNTWASPRLGQVARGLEPCIPGPVAIAGYGEPSAVFLIGTSTFLTKGPSAGQSAANWLNEGGGRLAFVNRRAETGFAAQIARAGLKRPRKIGCVTGLNVGRFANTDFALYAVAARGELAACRLPDYARCETQE